MKVVMGNAKHHVCKVGTVLTIIMLLVLTTVFLTETLFHASLSDFAVSDLPLFNDEIHYWHEILTFSVAGFNGGYYVIDELPAQASFSHFGPHGPMFPMIFGFVARFVGWSTYSSVLLNIVVIALALGAFVYLARPDEEQSLVTVTFLTTFWPLLLFLPSSMQQSLHQAIAILLAGLFYRLIQKKRESTRLRLALLVTIVTASLIRPTWSILFLPYLLLRTRRPSLLAIVRALSLSILLMATTFLAYRYLKSPYPYNWISTFLELLKHSPWKGITLLMRHLIGNLRQFAYFERRLILHQLLWYQALFLVVVGLAGHLRLPKHTRVSVKPQAGGLGWFHLVNLGGVLALQVLFETVIDGKFRDYRHLAPHLLLSLLLVVFLSSRRWLIGLIIVSNIVAFPWFIGTYTQVRKHNFVYDRSSIISFQEQTAGILVYEESDNPWCNTLAVDLETYTPPLIGVPGGMGLSLIQWENVELPLKSKYVVLQPELFQEIIRTPRGSSIHLEPLAETLLGVLYLNLDSQCTR